MTNAALHTGASFEVGISPLENGDVRVSVTDESIQELPDIRLASLDATGGRGLNVVDALACAWGVDHHQQGKVVWFEARPSQPSP